MIRLTLTAVALAACGAALAKLPPIDDAAKAKAAETAAKAAWQAKVDAFKLCEVQNRVAAQVRKGGTSVPTAAVKPTSAAPAAAMAKPANGTAPAAPAAAAPAPAPAAPAAAPSAPGTPVANVMATPPIPPCVEPGPFAYNPPEQKPLETSGAHSPTGTAASPPSVRPESAKMAPVKPGTAPSTGK